jgi:CheY-like chemotaxis protein
MGADFGWSCMPAQSELKPLEPTILLVEDSEDDAFVMNRALKQAGLGAPIHVLTDGQQAIDYFAGKGAFSDRDKFPVPSVLFLDLKLPYATGFEVLSSIREQPEFSSLQVAILTGSPEQRDRENAMVLGAQHYLVKPPTKEMLKALFEAMKQAR